MPENSVQRSDRSGTAKFTTFLSSISWSPWASTPLTPLLRIRISSSAGASVVGVRFQHVRRHGSAYPACGGAGDGLFQKKQAAVSFHRPCHRLLRRLRLRRQHRNAHSRAPDTRRRHRRHDAAVPGSGQQRPAGAKNRVGHQRFFAGYGACHSRRAVRRPPVIGAGRL